MADVSPTHVGQLSPDGQWRWDGTAWRSVEPWRLPAWANRRTRFPAGWAAVAGALVTGFVADQALRSGTFGVAASGLVVVGAAVVVLAGRVERVESRLMAAATIVLAACLSLRASPWLLWPDLAATALLLGAAGSFAVRGSVYDVGAAEAVARSIRGAMQLGGGAGFVARPVLQARGRVSTAVPVIRGVLIALPIAAVIAALLASADPVFASFFVLHVDLGRLAADVIYVALGALLAAGLVRHAASEPVEGVDGPAWRLGATEALVVLAIVDAVFMAFALAQVLAVTGAAAQTLRASGVTYSDYARSGFFQLLWVSGITLVVLVVAARISRLSERRARFAFLVFAQCAIALTLMIDVVAFRRLSLYEEAYGFTMLRLYSHVFAAWSAVVFLLLAADLAGAWRRRRWFIGATVTTALFVLLGLNVVNPEAVVVELNTSHAQTAHRIDAQYLSELSSDAVPALLASRGGLGPDLQRQVTEAACAGPRSYGPGLAAFNWSDAQAAEARRGSCASP